MEANKIIEDEWHAFLLEVSHVPLLRGPQSGCPVKIFGVHLVFEGIIPAIDFESH